MNGRILWYDHDTEVILKLDLVIEIIKINDSCVVIASKGYANIKGSSSKRRALDMDDDLEQQHRVAMHQDNYQSSGAEDDLSE